MKKFLVIICSLLLLTLVVGCGSKEYQVVFKDGETTLETQIVAQDSLLTKPTDPTKDSTVEYTYSFDGWYNGETKWDFDNDKVTNDLTLVARYTENVRSYTVTIKDDDGTVLSTENVDYGSKVTAPTNPTKDSTAEHTYSFDGWYNGEVKWDFTTEITGDLTLVAKYVENTRLYNVVFKDANGEVLKSEELAYGSVVTAPTVTLPTNTAEYTYSFGGWMVDEVLTDVSSVSADVIYVAVVNKTAVEYKISYYDENDELIDEVNVAFGSEVSLLDVPSKPGYVGVWTGTTYETMPAQNVSYKASYELGLYKATVILDSEPLNPVAVIEYTILNREEKLASIEALLVNEDSRFVISWEELPSELPLEDVTLVMVTEYASGVESFDDIDVIEANKNLSGVYDYLSNSKSSFPIEISDGKLVFTVTDISTFGVLSINLGKVVTGTTYTIKFDVNMVDENFEEINKGFAYALGTQAGVGSSHSSLLQSFGVLGVNGIFTTTFTPNADVENLYLLIRSQKNYENSTLTMDNLQIAELEIDEDADPTVDTFDVPNVIEANKQLTSLYTYYSNSGSAFPIVSNNGNLVFTIKNISTTGVLSIDLGKVLANVTYTITLDVNMKDASGNAILDGFAYALGSLKGATSGSVGANGLVKAYELFETQGTITFEFTPTADMNNLFLLIRSQTKAGHLNSTVTIDNVSIKTN